MQVLRFRLKNTTLAIPARQVEHICWMAELERPPGLPQLLEGFLNFHGQAIPVVKLGLLLQGETTPLEPFTHLVILKNGTAWIVDEALGVGEAGEPLPRTGTLNDWSTAQLADGAALADVDHILLQAEQARLAELTRMAQQRLDQLAN